MRDLLEGLSSDAKDFLAKHVPVCPHCEVPLSYPEKIGIYFGVMGAVHPLYKHKLLGGGFAYEFLQVARASGDWYALYLGLRTLDRIFWWR